MTGEGRFADFEGFWPFYVSQHSRVWTRRLHFAGTTGAMAILAAAGLLRRPALAAVAPLVAYGLAWFAHFAIENNRPATFLHPWWSLRGDFRMFSLMLRRQMNAETARLLRAPAPRGPASPSLPSEAR